MSAMNPRAMIVVGAGVSGTRAAVAIREGGWAGPVCLLGEETDHPYDRPPLSKAGLAAADGPAPTPLVPEGSLAVADIEHVAGVAVVDVDRDSREVVLADGSSRPYERLLLATGARPRRLNLPGAEEALYLRDARDAEELRRRLLPGARVTIIGGGFLGLEVAASADRRGCVVTVVEMADRVLGRVVPPEIAEIVAQRHLANGVDLRCGIGIQAITRESADVVVELSDGSRIPSDVVLASVGAVPETALAEKAGLAVQNGVTVDATLTTSDPHLLAAGDCCSFPIQVYDGRRMRLEAWRNAQDQGEHAAKTMLGSDLPFGRVPWFWSDQYELSLQIAGLPDAGNNHVTRARSDGVILRFVLDDGGRLVATSAIGEGNTVAKDIRLAEMLIEHRAVPDPGALTDPTVSLKSLLRQQAAVPN
jgi:3-phenylpropionate/trans-cinnamate dioxygenase ferredoxin reductase subunit